MDEVVSNPTPPRPFSFAPAKQRCPFERSERACECSLIAESRPKIPPLPDSAPGSLSQIFPLRVDSKLDEPLMN